MQILEHGLECFWTPSAQPKKCQFSMHFMVGNRRWVPLTGDQICFILEDKLYLQQKHTTVEPLFSKTTKRHLRDRRMYPLKRGLNRSQFIDCPPKKVAVEERLPFLESGGRRWRFDCITASKNLSRFQSHKVPQAKGHFDYEQSPFFLRDSRASETRKRVKITPREKRRQAWGDFHARSRFDRSTIPEGKWGLLVVQGHFDSFQRFITSKVWNRPFRNIVYFFQKDRAEQVFNCRVDLQQVCTPSEYRFSFLFWSFVNKKMC